MILEKRIPLKYLISIVKSDLVIVLSIGLLSHFLAARFMEPFPAMPLAIPAFLGTSLSVLLSFKMNQSYERWWEARKAWGSIINDSRTLVVQLQSYLNDTHTQEIQKIAYRQIAWCYITSSSLRGREMSSASRSFLSDRENAQLAFSHNHPLALLKSTSKDIKTLRSNGSIDIHGQIHLQETIIRLTDSLGVAERINRTIFPSTYRLVLHFIIYLFVITLAISLKEIDYSLVVPLLLLISASFLLIEKIAYHLQDPFRNRPSDVPVTDISENIERDIRSLLGETIGEKQIQPGKYYVM
jgi:putative membrane protein